MTVDTINIPDLDEFLTWSKLMFPVHTWREMPIKNLGIVNIHTFYGCKLCMERWKIEKKRTIPVFAVGPHNNIEVE